MSVNVSFLGTSYAIPSIAGESGWTSLTSYLVALASGAASTAALNQAIRVATTSPVTVSTTDCTVVVDRTVAGYTSVTLPVGVTKQIFIIVDGKGDAGTYAITIESVSGQAINGAANYSLTGNRQGVMLQFDGTQWRILSQFLGTSPTFSNVVLSTLRVLSFAAGVVHSDGSGNLTSSSVTDSDVSASAAIALSKLAALATSRALQSGTGGVIEPSSVTASQLATLGAGGNLAAVAALATSGFAARTGAGAFAGRTLTPNSAKLSIVNGDGVAGSPVFDVEETYLNLSNLGGTLSALKGGTAQSSYAKGDFVYASAVNTLSKLTIGSTGQLLRVSSSGIPEWFTGAGTGDVVGPTSVTDGRVVAFDTATGKLIKQGTQLASDLVTGPGTIANNGVAVFNGTSGKVIAQASGTGYAKLSSGVLLTPAATIPVTDLLGRTDGASPSAGQLGESNVGSYTSATTLTTSLADLSGYSAALQAGRYLISYQVPVKMQYALSATSTGGVAVQFDCYNSTAGTSIANGVTGYSQQDSNQAGTGTSTIIRNVTLSTACFPLNLSAAATIKVRGKYISQGTVSITSIAVDQDAAPFAGDDFNGFLSIFRIG